MSKYIYRLEKTRQKAYKDIINFIVSYVDKHKISPSLQLIANHLGVARNAVDKRIRQLVELGYVTKIDNLPRSLAVTDAGVEFKKPKLI